MRARGCCRQMLLSPRRGDSNWSIASHPIPTHANLRQLVPVLLAANHTPSSGQKKFMFSLYRERERETHSVVSLSICFNSLAHGCHLTLCENARDSVRKRSRRSRFVRSPTLSPVRFAGTHLTPLGLARSKRPLSRPWARSRRPAVHGRRLPELP